MKKKDYIKRKKYKEYYIMRKNPEKFIPHNEFYCYVFGINKRYRVCPFLIDSELEKHLKCFRNSKVKHDCYTFDCLSARCSLTGHWILDYIKHCKINECVEEG